MKSGKRHLTSGMELPNQDKIRTLREKETYEYLGILDADTIKQVEILFTQTPPLGQNMTQGQFLNGV